MERNVTINEDQQLYVIHHGTGVSCWGFDVVLDRIKRMAIELAGRGVLPAEYMEVDDIEALAAGDMAAVRQLLPERGSMRAYDTMQLLTERLESVCKEQHDRAVFDLSPQLMGLEGWRVEVVDKPGDKPRRFIVGRSTGWAPCHLEISRRTANGGGAARHEYHHVREIEQVR